MSKLPHPGPNAIARGEREDESGGGFTRRRVLAGAAAATAAMSVGALDSPASAQTRQDMVAFVLLSAALTGIPEGKVAPNCRPLPSPTNIDLEQSAPGSGPADAKQEYFKWVNRG